MKRMMHASFFTLFTLMLTLALCQPLQAQAGSNNEKEGIQAAATWLDLVDSGAYGLSWAGAGKVFKAAVSQGQWDSTAAAVRGPLGKLVHRKLDFHQLSDTLAGMPDGLYLSLRYMTKFEKKAHALETLTLVKEDDGVFRVIGYFIK
ncbi:MAG: DUF4019 domain-containing protein [Desulfobacter sp.]|nr:MAG: DUF4019 domain-containing protein [Desulfobacter sp.]